MNTNSLKNEYETLKRLQYVGFANKYLEYGKAKSKSDDEIDITVYTKLVQIDSKLGTTASEQLFRLFNYSLRLDLLKVSIPFRVIRLKLF